jgi:voltage-gated sodium channel
MEEGQGAGESPIMKAEIGSMNRPDGSSNTRARTPEEWEMADRYHKAQEEAKRGAEELKVRPGVMGHIRDLSKVQYNTVPKKFKDKFPKLKRYGPIARLARNQNFEYFTLSIIGLNAIWIGVDTDRNKAEALSDSKDIFKVAENFFCLYFTFEVAVRFLAFKRKFECLFDGWMVFDSLLVSMMVLETWIFPFVLKGDGLGPAGGILRLLRLLRLTRMARLMRAVPEILTLVKGMLAATRSVFSTLVLLILLIYVFAIVFKSQLGAEPGFEETFGDLSITIFTLILQGSLLDDISGLMLPMIQRDDPFAFSIILMLLFILMSAFTVLNMLIGVLCEVVSETQAGERDQLQVTLVQEKIEDVLENIDEDGSGMISKKEFESIKDDPIVKEALEEIGVEPKHLLALSDSLFEMDDDEVELRLHEERMKQRDLIEMQGGVMSDEDSLSASSSKGIRDEDKIREDGKELTFQDFLKTICHLRPENDCSVMDVAEVRKMMRRALRKTELAIDEFGSRIVNLDKHGVPQAHVETLHALLDNAKDLRAKVSEEAQAAEKAEKLAEQLQAQLSKLG